MSSGNIDAGALEVFRRALIQFGEEAIESLQTAQLEISRTYEWLGRRKKDCEKKAYRCQQDLEQAKVQYVRNPNGNYREAVRIAQNRLREVEEEYQKVMYWSKQIQQFAAPYQVQAAKLSLLLRNDLRKATVSLEERIDFLKSFPPD